MRGRGCGCGCGCVDGEVNNNKEQRKKGSLARQAFLSEGLLSAQHQHPCVDEAALLASGLLGGADRISTPARCLIGRAPRVLR